MLSAVDIIPPEGASEWKRAVREVWLNEEGWREEVILYGTVAIKTCWLAAELESIVSIHNTLQCYTRIRWPWAKMAPAKKFVV